MKILLDHLRIVKVNTSPRKYFIGVLKKSRGTSTIAFRRLVEPIIDNYKAHSFLVPLALTYLPTNR